MGENVTRGAIGVVLLILVLAVAALGLAAAFAVIYLRLAANLPPSGATLVAAALLCLGVVVLVMLARWLHPVDDDDEPAVREKRQPARSQKAAQDGFDTAFAATVAPRAVTASLGPRLTTDLHADPADHPRRYRGPRQRRPSAR